MRNLFFFIRRYAHFLFFLFLQGLSVYLIVTYNRHHNALFSSTLNEWTGTVNKQYNRVEDYLQLRDANERLVKANETLFNRLKENFLSADTASKLVTDSIPIDTLGTRRKWMYKMAKVVGNSVSSPANYIQLNRGSRQQLSRDLGVVDAGNAVVGKIVELSDNYAVVMSLLHKDSKISARLKNSAESEGFIVWNGKQPNFLNLTDIKKSVKVAVGDTVVTSGFTNTFPAGIIIGTVTEIVPEKSTNNYSIRIKSAANFYNLQYVYAIDNLQKEELEKLMEKVKKKEQSPLTQ